ncbi:MAG: S1 RNA-binding domain-containing protein [Bacilli bacterium]|jgi:predicted RNA-binding protein with RPS1 domain|nr:S1 RNA-binding domain-containing protein [Bacilli bacterium]
MPADFKVGEIIEGTITELRKFGALMIFDHDATGLLHISEVSDRFVFDIARYVQVGRNFNVKILEIDPNNGFMKVSLRKVTIEDRIDFKNSAKKRMVVDEDEIDFSPLQEQLGKWTEKQLENIPGEGSDVKS